MSSSDAFASPTWRWRAEPLAPAPIAIFDLDGVISDAQHRQHFLADGRRDWDGFFNAAGDDPIIAEGEALVSLLDPGLGIVVLTARPLKVQALTIDWLARNRIRHDLLIMRADSDFGSSAIVKRQAVTELVGLGFEPLLAVDDEQGNVNMYRQLDIPTVYRHSGYYD